MAEISLSNIAQFESDGSHEIEILSEHIVDKIDYNSRITDAVLTLKTIRVSDDGYEIGIVNDDGSFDVIDYVSPSNGDNVYINITEELNRIIKAHSRNITIRINGSIEFSTESRLDITYIPERVMYDGNTYCEVDVGKAGSGKVNVSTGALNFIHNDSSISGISHVYNTWQANKTGADFDYPDVLEETKNAIAKYGDYGCGKGWKLNVHQYLIKRKGTDSQDLYTYVDGAGNYHEFSEKYYYMSGETKVYLDKKDVHVGFDGKLTYEDMEVKPELMTTGGYILRTDYTGFAGAEKLELRSEDKANLEEEIENLKRTISDCEYALVEYKKAETEQYKALMILQERIEDDSSVIDHKNLSAQTISNEIMGRQNGKNLSDGIFKARRDLDDAMRKNNDGGYAAEPGRSVDEAQSAYETAYEILQDASATVAAMQASAASDTGDSGPARYQLEAQNEATLNVNSAEKRLNEAQKVLNTKLELLQQFIREKSNDIEEANWDASQDIVAAQSALLDLQDQYRNDKRAYNKAEEERQRVRNDEMYKRSEADLAKAKNLLERREFELSSLIDQEPVRFILSGDGSIMGFNDAGVLMVIADVYENATYINYEDGHIVSITDTDDNETAFEYEDGHLIKIVDADEKVITFDYFSNGTLAAIIYPDGTSSSFGYDSESGILTSVVNPAGYGIRFTYSERKITKIEETTLTYEITDEGWRGFNSEEEENEYGPKLLTAISYNTHFSSSVTDRAGHKLTYIFDVYGKPATIYEGDYNDQGRNTKSISVDYNEGLQSFSIEDKIMSGNILERLANVQLNGELHGDAKGISRKEYDIDVDSLPDDVTNFVFSAWVKADSAYIPSERKTSYSTFSSETSAGESDIYKQNRKFALRAELEYVTERNTTEQEEFHASFDWLNTGWQYLALPIGIREADRIGDRIVGKFPFKLGGGDRKLTRLKVIIDYSYNVNGIYDGSADAGHTGLLYDCVTLREGDWTYSKLGPDGKAEYTENSANGNTTFYEYDNDGHIVKETVKDKAYRTYIHSYEYNKKGALIRDTDHNGLCKETVYDDKGRTVKSMTYNIADPTSKFYSESVRDEKGRVTADVDVTGKFNSAEYTLDHKGIVNLVKDANGAETAYGYHNDELVSISTDCENNENKNTLKHTLGYTTRVSSGETDYTYTYDGWGRAKTVSIGGALYSETVYVDDKTTKVNLATGESLTEYADGEDDATVTISVSEADGEKEYVCKTARTYYALPGGQDTEQTVEYYDEEFGLARRSIDKSGEIVYTTDYRYDNNGRLLQRTETGIGVMSVAIEYNAEGGAENSEYNINGIKQKYSYEYDSALSDKKIGLTLPGGAQQKVGYDGLGRVDSVELTETLPDGGSNTFTKDIYYAKFGDHATKYVSSVWFGTKGKRDENIRYTYDNNGNISTITENGDTVARYTYDVLGRLVREDNKILGKTEVFEYDNNGNILAKTKYAYTLKEEPENGERVVYSYSSEGWKDRLVGFGNDGISGYNGIGCPSVYRGKQLRWAKGRDLIAIGDESYVYNATGLRIGKTVGEEKFVYYLDDGKIVAEERRNKADNALVDTICYHYGAEGITGFEIVKPDGTSATYVYRKNINGDITHIYTAGGDLIAKYVYDAWGNHTAYAASGYEEIAARNAIRYRGYYYDVSTKLYYLKSRYYDPEVGRFISADAISELDAEEVNGLNLYRYCANNPVMMNDTEGNAPAWWEWLVSGVLLVAGTVLCATGVGSALGAGLISAGGSMMASNIMSAAGVDGKVASIISAGLNIAAGVVLCATGIGGALGASMIGSGVGSIGGGFLSEALGFGFEAGAMIGGVVGGIVGGQIFKGVSALTAKKYSLEGLTPHQKGVMGEKYISKVTGMNKNNDLIESRIPDFIDERVLIESKNVARQGLTKQLVDYMEIAQNRGIPMELYVRKTTVLSEALKVSGIIIKYFPW